MDYKFRIERLELELAHLRELQALESARQAWFERVMETINRTTANLLQQGKRNRNGGQRGEA